MHLLVLLTNVYRDTRCRECKGFRHFHFPARTAKCHFIGRYINESSALRSVSYNFGILISKYDPFVKTKISYKRNRCHLRLNTFTAIVNLSRFNNSCLKSSASTLVDLTFQSHALRSFSLNQLRNLSL